MRDSGLWAGVAVPSAAPHGGGGGERRGCSAQRHAARGSVPISLITRHTTVIAMLGCGVARRGVHSVTDRNAEPCPAPPPTRNAAVSAAWRRARRRGGLRSRRPQTAPTGHGAPPSTMLCASAPAIPSNCHGSGRTKKLKLLLKTRTGIFLFFFILCVCEM